MILCVFVQTAVDEDEEGCSDSLSGLYHALAHSAQGMRLLQLEHQYSSEVALLVKRCDQCLQELETKCVLLNTNRTGDLATDCCWAFIPKIV